MKGTGWPLGAALIYQSPKGPMVVLYQGTCGDGEALVLVVATYDCQSRTINRTYASVPIDDLNVASRADLDEINGRRRREGDSR